MKVLIWIGAFVIAVFAQGISDAIFQAIFKGYRMGALLRYAFVFLMIFIGRNLSRRWDMRCLRKKASKEGKSRKEYLIAHMPRFIIEICEDRHTKSAIEEMLKPHVKERVITSAEARALAEEFGI